MTSFFPGLSAQIFIEIWTDQVSKMEGGNISDMIMILDSLGKQDPFRVESHNLPVECYYSERKMFLENPKK